jgi:ABC-type branched-subunit amino acid transport system substrate-binding protein
MRVKTKWLAIFAVLGLVLAACSPSGTTDTTEPDTTGTTQAAPDTTQAAPDTTEGGGILTDVGVDLEAGTITVGLLSDLTGVFSALVTPVVAGYEAYIAKVNAEGGVGGLTVVVEKRDTVYSVDTHVQLYGELKDQVVAFGHSTGSPHTVAINEQLQADGIFAVPLTWYSGWSDPALNASLVPHGVPYCIESMNVIGWLKDQMGDGISTIAIASNADDYGQDSAQGAKKAADALGLNVVYDGEGKVNAADEASLTEVANGIIGSTPDLVWVTTSPGAYSSIYGQALAAGIVATWSGSFPDWNPAFVAPDSPIADPIQRDMYIGLPVSTWDGAGAAGARDLILSANPDATPFEYYFEGIVEATITVAALQAAYDAGDMTQAGVLAAAKSLESVTFDGLAPDETYVGDANSRLQRKMFIAKPSQENLLAGGSGLVEVESNYSHPIADAYEFTETCFSAFG